MFLVAGLGNPGEEYALTPHNLGFLTMDRLAERHGIRVTRKDSRALVGVGEIDGQPVMLAKPQTFMNLSGTSLTAADGKARVRSGAASWWFTTSWICPGWRCKIKPKGSAAGHNGMKSVIASLGTSGFRAGAHGDSSGPSREGWRGIRAGAVPALAEQGIGRIHRLCGRCGSIHNRRGRRKGHDEIQSSRPRLKQQRKHEDLRRAVHREAGCSGRRGRPVRGAVANSVDRRRGNGRQSRKMGQAPAGLQSG